MNFDKIINRKGTYCTQWDYIEDRFGEKDLLPFSISDMDIPTSPEISDILTKRVNHGIFGYTRWNHSDYKGSIVSWYHKRFQTSLHEDWIAYSPNVMYAVARFLNFVDHNKGVCIMTPCYDGFIKVIQANNLPMNTVPQDNHEINWDYFEQQLTKSSVLLLCNPNNPNGHVWTEEEQIKIINLCKKHKVFIISDDIHMDFIYKPYKFTPILKTAAQQDYLDNTAIITSSSKTFNLSGLGGAYIICPNKKIREQFIFTLNNKDSLGSAPTLHVESLMVGYNQSEYWVNELCDYIHNNAMYVHQYLKEHLPMLHHELPQGTYFSWIDCSTLNLTMAQIQEKLIQKGKVAIMDGDRYLAQKPFLRFLNCCPHSKVIEGLKRIHQSFID
ncbi:MAG: MalY/PatB family protein [Brevinema sp.]